MGAPDLTVEVLSPSTALEDRVDKHREYALAGVTEYWIVNPEDETITVLRLQGEQYAEHGVFRRGDTATSALLAGFTLSVNDVFDAR